MKYNIVAKRDAPLPPYNCEMFCFPVEAVPIILDALWLKSQKYWWATPEDATAARLLLAQVEEGLLMPCGTIIADKLDNLYRLMDTSLNGVQYNFSGAGTATDPFVFTPVIPTVPDLQEYSYPGMRAMADITSLLVRNLVDGSPVQGVSETRNFRQQLEDLLTALQAQTEGEIDYTALIEQLIILLA